MESTVIWAWVIWLGIGALAGWLAGRIMGSRPFGLIGDIIFGILGSVVGGWIFGLFGAADGGIFWSFFVAIVGAIVVLWLIRLFKKA